MKDERRLEHILWNKNKRIILTINFNFFFPTTNDSKMQKCKAGKNLTFLFAPCADLRDSLHSNTFGCSCSPWYRSYLLLFLRGTWREFNVKSEMEITGRPEHSLRKWRVSIHGLAELCARVRTCTYVRTETKCGSSSSIFPHLLPSCSLNVDASTSSCDANLRKRNRDENGTRWKLLFFFF